MSDGDGGPPSGEDGHVGGPAEHGDEEPVGDARSPATDPRAPELANPRRRLVVVGVVVLMLAASIGGVAWALTQSPDGPVEAPDVAFDLSVQADGSATLAHAGGGSPRAGSLVVAVDGDRATWADLRFDTGPDDRVTAGDSVTLVGVESSQTVTVYYVEDGQEVPLANATVTAA
ncbi:hypothetical protein [Haloarchaeobius salinus]|uniref:hypothetical protein n=1 Tax=Haloarchaeobius salinus TaxID=1198298 RepID=UPI00210EB7DA|nr:hypothetical protein [Haloarchaeobius salinus]